MIKKLRKIEDIKARVVKRPVLRLVKKLPKVNVAKPTAKKFWVVPMQDIVPELISEITPFVPSDLSACPVAEPMNIEATATGVLSTTPEPARQWVYGHRPQIIRQPLISSFISKQKIKLTPRAANMFKLAALAVLCIIVGVPAMSAFEAHVVNVTAELREINPPTLSTQLDPPGNPPAWDNPNGGSGFATDTPLTINMTDGDVDATNIYYTFMLGTLIPGDVPDPICGQLGPNGGGGAGAQSLIISASSAVKAIACDGSGPSSHKSFINIKIYSFDDPLEALVINEFLPHPAAGDIGVPGGHTSNNGGEWVELFNGLATSTDITGFKLADSNNNLLTISAANAVGSLNMPPGGFVVVYRDGDPNFELDTASSGSVSLFDASNFPIDSETYTGPVPVGKSIARVPDASPVWFDPCPTPGAPNVDTECPAEVVSALADASATMSTVLDVADNASTTHASDVSTTPDVGSSGNGGSSGGSDSNSQVTSPTADTASTTAPSTDNSALAGASSDTVVLSPDATSTPPTDEQAPDASSVPPKQDEAIVPQQQNQDQAIAPAPVSDGGSSGGNTPPPPAPADGPGADSIITGS